MSRPVTPLSTRFWSKVNKTETCWEWTGALGKLGYGNIEEAGRCYSSHRASWTMANGPIPHGAEVCHHCDNRKCVRPDHLFLGTHEENMADAAAKKRMRPTSRPGEANPRHILSSRDIPYIRELNGIGFTQRELGMMYGVSQVMIGNIVRRKAWSHIP